MSKSDNVRVAWVTQTWTMFMSDNIWIVWVGQCLSCPSYLDSDHVWVTLTQTKSKLDNIWVVCIAPNSDNVQVRHCPSYPSWTMSELSELPQLGQCPAWTGCLSCPPTQKNFNLDNVQIRQVVQVTLPPPLHKNFSTGTFADWGLGRLGAFLLMYVARGWFSTWKSSSWLCSTLDFVKNKVLEPPAPPPQGWKSIFLKGWMSRVRTNFWQTSGWDHRLERTPEIARSVSCFLVSSAYVRKMSLFAPLWPWCQNLIPV